MRVVLQRVKQASVEVAGQVAGKISRGILLFIGVERGDGKEDVEFLARKSVELRIFPDREGKMNLSLTDINGEVLAVSQFTLAASTRKGRRPSFDSAEEPERAEERFKEFVAWVRAKGFKVETGAFQAIMDVQLVNEGPVTFILESRKSSPEEAAG